MGGSTPALAAILSITLLIGVLLKYSYFREYPIVDRVRNVSLTAAVFFRKAGVERRLVHIGDDNKRWFLRSTKGGSRPPLLYPMACSLSLGL